MLDRLESRPRNPLLVLRYWPSIEKDSSSINVLTSSVASQAPVAASQSRTVLSSEADASRRPSGENATALTQSLWPLSVASHAPVAASQSRTVSSSEADASRRPSGENATALTQSLWSSSVAWQTSQLSLMPLILLIDSNLSCQNC